MATTTITIKSRLKHNSAIGNSNPNKIGGWNNGIIYQMFYNRYSFTIEIEGKNDSESKREKVKNAVREYSKNNFCGTMPAGQTTPVKIL